MDDITLVRSHWWLVSEGFSLSTANSDVLLSSDCVPLNEKRICHPV